MAQRPIRPTAQCGAQCWVFLAASCALIRKRCFLNITKYPGKTNASLRPVGDFLHVAWTLPATASCGHRSQAVIWRALIAANVRGPSMAPALPGGNARKAGPFTSYQD